MRLQSENVLSWLNKEAHTVELEIPLAPHSFSYKLISREKFFGKKKRSFPMMIPTESYAHFKEVLTSWLRTNLPDAPEGQELRGIIFDHVFSFPDSYRKKDLNRWIDEWEGEPGPTTVGKGDVHDNLNKGIPDALKEIGHIKDDKQIVLCLSGKFRGDSNFIRIKLFYLPHDHAAILP